MFKIITSQELKMHNAENDKFNIHAYSRPRRVALVVLCWVISWLTLNFHESDVQIVNSYAHTTANASCGKTSIARCKLRNIHNDTTMRIRFHVYGYGVVPKRPPFGARSIKQTYFRAFATGLGGRGQFAALLPAVHPASDVHL